MICKLFGLCSIIVMFVMIEKIRNLMFYIVNILLLYLMLMFKFLKGEIDVL